MCNSLLPGRANVVVDVLSQKSYSRLACMRCYRSELYAEMTSLGVKFEQKGAGVMLAQFRVRPMILDRIRELQMYDERLMKTRKR